MKGKLTLQQISLELVAVRTLLYIGIICFCRLYLQPRVKFLALDIIFGMVGVALLTILAGDKYGVDIIDILYLLLITFIIFEDIVKTLVVDAFLYAFLVVLISLSNSLMAFVWSYFQLAGSTYKYSQLTSLFAIVLPFVLVYLLTPYFRRLFNGAFSQGHLLALSVVPISTALIVLAYMKVSYYPPFYKELSYFTLLLLFLLAINIGFVVLQSKTSGFYIRQINKDQLENQLEKASIIQKNEEERISRERELTADFKDILTEIKETDYNKEDSEKLIKEFLAKEEISDYTEYTTLPVVDETLNGKTQLCQIEGINLKIESDITTQPEVDYTQLATVLSMAIENAMESQFGDDYQINVKAITRHNMVILIVENPFENQVLRKADGSFITTKEENNRGYGIKGMKDIIGENKGVLQIDPGENFVVRIIFFEE